MPHILGLPHLNDIAENLIGSITAGVGAFADGELMSNVYGVQRSTVDEAIDTTGQRVKVLQIVATSGATSGILIVRHGSDVTAPEMFRLTPAANASSGIFMGGATWPDGCFLDLDANITQVATWYNRY